MQQHAELGRRLTNGLLLSRTCFIVLLLVGSLSPLGGSFIRQVLSIVTASASVLLALLTFYERENISLRLKEIERLVSRVKGEVQDLYIKSRFSLSRTLANRFYEMEPLLWSFAVILLSAQLSVFDHASATQTESDGGRARSRVEGQIDDLKDDVSHLRHVLSDLRDDLAASERRSAALDQEVKRLHRQLIDDIPKAPSPSK